MLSSLRLRSPVRGAAPRASARLASAAPGVDVAMLWVVGALLITGLVMVYSASIALPDSPRFARYAPTRPSCCATRWPSAWACWPRW